MLGTHYFVIEHKAKKMPTRCLVASKHQLIAMVHIHIEYTLFDHILNLFHRVNQVLLPKNTQKCPCFSVVEISAQGLSPF